METKYYVKVQLKNKKAWNFLKSNGDISRNKIHGVVYPNLESAEAEVKHINSVYSEWYTSKVEKVT